MTVQILIGDTLEILRKLSSNSVHCVVTSPPYWGLRDYGVVGQIGLEPTPAEFIGKLVSVFEEVRRVLRPDGTCWVNMGDSYSHGGGGSKNDSRWPKEAEHGNTTPKHMKASTGLKPKDLCMMPHRLAIALQDAGWYVRQDIVWAKPNPMPESVTDRCTKSHEYIFLLTKTGKYYFDAEAIAEPVTGSTVVRLSQDLELQVGSDRVPGKTNGRMKAVGTGVGFGRGYDKVEKPRAVRVAAMIDPAASARLGRGPGWRKTAEIPTHRNKRSVWTMATHSFKEAHFATFPPELPETCIKAGCPVGGVVLDPFFGAGTTGLVADRLQRDCIGIELNPEYANIAARRIRAESTLLADVQVAA